MRKMSNEEYNRYIERLSPPSPMWKNCLNAFWTGGLICLLGQVIFNLFSGMGWGKEEAGTAVCICLIFLSAVLTALSVYDDIAKFAGAGTLVPITGFANAVVSPAMEFKSEGFVTGMAAKMFTIAGPVIVYGTVAGVIYGVVYWITTLF